MHLFRLGGYLLLALFSFCCIATPILAAESDGWQTLFDGSSLEAWRDYQRGEDATPKNWEIVDGVLSRKAGGGGDLITREQFGDFEMEFEWKISPGGNSGVIYRVTEEEPQTYMTGPEYQVLDNGDGKEAARKDTAAGSLYALYSPSTDAAKPAGAWNKARIVVDGTKIEHWLNGEKIVEADMASDDWKERIAKSKFANWKRFAKNKKGHIALQEHGHPVWYRNIRIRPLDQESSASAKPARLLFLTQSAGFKHGSVTRKAGDLSPSERVMTELGLRSGLFRTNCSQDAEHDFTREALDNHDIVMFYTTGGYGSGKNDLPIDKETLDYFLNDWLKQKGHGFIGVHSATDTFHNYEPYWDMIGGTFDGHPWGADATVTVTVHEPSHPVAKPWGEEFVIKDEIYQFKNWQPDKVRVLMSLNMEKTELKKPRHVPIAWVKNYGDGKAMHMSLGHREDVWTNPTYQESLLGGVKWILGKEEGDATPNPELSAREEEKAKAAAK